ISLGEFDRRQEAVSLALLILLPQCFRFLPSLWRVHERLSGLVVIDLGGLVLLLQRRQPVGRRDPRLGLVIGSQRRGEEQNHKPSQPHSTHGQLLTKTANALPLSRSSK